MKQKDRIFQIIEQVGVLILTKLRVRGNEEMNVPMGAWSLFDFMKQLPEDFQNYYIKSIDQVQNFLEISPKF